MGYLKETVYTNKANTIDLVLKNNGVALPDHTVITRVLLEFDQGQAAIDSQTDPAYFDLTNTDRIVLKLSQAGLAAGRYEMTVNVYDPSSALPYEWRPKIQITVE